MHRVTDIGLANVQAEYGAANGDISQLIMGEQLHVGGLQSTVVPILLVLVPPSCR